MLTQPGVQRTLQQCSLELLQDSLTCLRCGSNAAALGSHWPLHPVQALGRVERLSFSSRSSSRHSRAVQVHQWVLAPAAAASGLMPWQHCSEPWSRTLCCMKKPQQPGSMLWAFW